MKPEFAVRTLILAAWLVALLAYAPTKPRSMLLAVAIVLVWAVPLGRERRLRRRVGRLSPGVRRG